MSDLYVDISETSDKLTDVATRLGERTISNGNALAIVGDVLTEIRAHLVRLDTVDVSATYTTKAADVLTMARWERSTRKDLIAMQVSAQGLQDTVQRLISGTRRQVTHTVRAGDTLQGIAIQYLGSFENWYVIATTNNLDPAAALVAGTVITIPEPERAP